MPRRSPAAPRGVCGAAPDFPDGDVDAVSPPDFGTAIAMRLDRIAPDGALGVAVSGGGDSTALLVAAKDWASARRRDLFVATVDHGLRAEAAAEARAVEKLAQDLGLSHVTLTAPRLRPGNVNARARDARHGLLAGWARAEGLAAILLGHTLDDQAETVLMRLGRGSGVDGLSAMEEVSRRLGVHWLRPLLGLRRADLRRWLAARGIGWIDDPTNEDPAHQRVRLRHVLGALEEAGVAREMIAASAARLRAQRRVLDAVTAELAARALTTGPGGEIMIDRQLLAAADPEIAGRLVAASIRAITAADYAPRGAPLAAMVARLCACPPRGATLGGVLARPARGGRVLLCREPAAVAPEVALGPQGSTWDARWQMGPVDAKGLSLGALGPHGVCDLAPALRPAGWDDMAHVVRLTLPALRRGAELLGVPLAGSDMSPLDGAVRGVCARDLVRERLPFASWRR